MRIAMAILVTTVALAASALPSTPVAVAATTGGAIRVQKAWVDQSNLLLTARDPFVLGQVVPFSGDLGPQRIDLQPNVANSFAVDGLVPGSYDIVEDASPTYELQTVRCDPEAGAEATALLDANGDLAGVRVPVSDGDTWFCRFTNRLPVLGLWGFVSANDADGSRVVDDDLELAITDQSGNLVASLLADTNTRDGDTHWRDAIFRPLEPGRYTLTASPPPGHEVSRLTCRTSERFNGVEQPTGITNVAGGTAAGESHITFDLAPVPNRFARNLCDVGYREVVDVDRDDDGVTDADDNCPDDTNPDQLDWDRDGLGFACDADDDRLPSIESRSQGYWKRVFAPQGSPWFDDATLQQYLDAIGAHSTAFDGLGIPDARTILRERGDLRAAARSQALAAWLNWANGGTTFFEPITGDLRFGQLIDQVESALAGPHDPLALESAKNLAEAVNVR